MVRDSHRGIYGAMPLQRENLGGIELRLLIRPVGNKGLLRLRETVTENGIHILESRPSSRTLRLIRNSCELRADAVIFYYQPGLRSAWARIEKGQHVNSDPKDQANPFPTMIIGIRGRAVAKIGGVEKEFRAGQMVFIPAGVAHEAWNPFDEPAEIILLMFGEGA